MKKKMMKICIVFGLVFTLLGLSPTITEADEEEAPYGENELGYVWLDFHWNQQSADARFQCCSSNWLPAGIWEVSYCIIFYDVPGDREIRYGSWMVKCDPQYGSSNWASKSGIRYGPTPAIIEDSFTVDIPPKIGINRVYLIGKLDHKVYWLDPYQHSHDVHVYEDPYWEFKFYKAKEQRQSLVFNDLTNSQLESQTISFDCSASGGTTPYMYSWDYGDQVTADTKNATHRYTEAGTYIVSVNVTDNAGYYTLAEKEITVT